MKTILSLLLAGMFGIEILSPFMIGYLNNQIKPTPNKINVIEKHGSDEVSEKFIKQKNYYLNTSINADEENYADSKSLAIKE